MVPLPAGDPVARPQRGPGRSTKLYVRLRGSKPPELLVAVRRLPVSTTSCPAASPQQSPLEALVRLRLRLAGPDSERFPSEEEGEKHQCPPWRDLGRGVLGDD